MHPTPQHAATEAVTLSETDLRLIDALQRRPRGTWTEIAGLVGVGRDVAARRWGQLHAAGVAWLAVYPARRWWDRHQLAWVEVEVTPGDLPQVVDALAADPTVMSVDVGPRGVLAAVAGSTYTTMGRALLAGRLHTPRSIHWATALHSNASVWRIGALPRDSGWRHPTARVAVGGPPPDERVRRVLAALGPDPRVPAEVVAIACGVSDWTARDWLRRMLGSEDLAIRCEVVPAAVARPVAVHWWLRVPDTAIPALVTALLDHPAVRWVASVDGTSGATVLAAFWERSPAAAHQLTAWLTGVVPAATTVARTFELRPVKRLGWLIDPDTGRRGEYVPLAI